MNPPNPEPPDEKQLLEWLLDEMNRGCEILELVAETCRGGRSAMAKRLARELRSDYTHWELAHRNHKGLEPAREQFQDCAFNVASFLEWQGEDAKKLATTKEGPGEAYAMFCENAGSRLAKAICDLMDRLEGKPPED